MSGLMTVSFWSHFGLISVFFVFFMQSAKNSAVFAKQVPPDYASQAKANYSKNGYKVAQEVCCSG